MTTVSKHPSSTGHELCLSRTIDAYVEAWIPGNKHFMTGVDRETHHKMGFHEGCGKAADQLAELVATL